MKREDDQPPVRTVLPRLERDLQLHNPIEVLGRSSTHLRLYAESTQRDAARADFNTTVVRNVDALRLEGSTPLPSRFRRMLDAIG